MEIKINGETRQVAGGISLHQVICELKIAGEGLAIEHNGKFIEEDTDWKELPIAEGDVLEIVRFVGGG